MDGEELVSAVRESKATQLDRLGSEKAIIAATGADLETDAVVGAAARLLDGARVTFERWAEAGDTDATEAFTDAAGSLADGRDALLDRGDDATADGEPPHVVDYLDGLEYAPERVAAGLVAYPLVAERQLLQVINFFVNEGEETRAELFRELRSDAGDTVDRGAELLDAVCDDEAAYERARDAAVETIERAYEEYASDLESLGIDPKPVC